MFYKRVSVFRIHWNIAAYVFFLIKEYQRHWSSRFYLNISVQKMSDYQSHDDLNQSFLAGFCPNDVVSQITWILSQWRGLMTYLDFVPMTWSHDLHGFCPCDAVLRLTWILSQWNGLMTYLDFVQVTRSHGLILQIRDQRHGPLELVHTVLTGINHLPILVLNQGQQPKPLDIFSLSLIISAL